MYRFVVLLSCLMLCSSSASAQAPDARGANRQPLRSSARVELIVGMGLGGALWAGALYNQLRAYDARSELQLLGVSVAGGLVTAATTLLLTPERMTNAQAQAINGGALWGATNAFVIPLSWGQESHIGPVAIVAAPLGALAGALLYELLTPTSGQVSATNSAGLLALGLLIAIPHSPQGDASIELATVGPIILNGGLVLGGALSAYKPLSRGDVLLADLMALGAGSVAMLTAYAFDSDIESLVMISSAATFLGFSIAYLALPELPRGGYDPGLDIALSIVPGDALFHAPGEVQGGAGVMLGFEW